MINKILSILWMLAIFSSDLIAMDDKPDENVMVLRSGRQIPKTVSVNSSLQLQTSQMGDDEGQVRKRKREEGKEEERHHLEMTPTIPLIARGHEAIYERFLNGVLIYRPKGDGNDVGRINLPIRNLGNPLEGTFDLSRCGDTGQHLSIATGYRKGKKPENSSKVEIWFAPRFLIEKELNTTAAHFKPIMGKWKQEAPVGMFWAHGAWDSLATYDYLTTKNMDYLSKMNLYENGKNARLDPARSPVKDHRIICTAKLYKWASRCFMFIL